MTVHKSQGMSLDEAIMDLSQVFEYGQGYVALSRVKRLSGLHLLGWNARSFQVHPQILAQDNQFRESSEAARTMLSQMSAADIESMHHNFILANGGKIVKQSKKKDSAGKKPGRSFEEIRKTHPNAYRRWQPEHDQQLTLLFNQGKTITELMVFFGRKEKAIILRLIKLTLLPEDYLEQNN
jgi:hypothetical protein